MDSLEDKVVDVLKKFAEDDLLADRVLALLDYGMWDEWDVGLCDGLKMGFGGDELKIAAKAAVPAAERISYEQK